MLTQRPVDLQEDRDFVLELVCMASYEGVPAWYKNKSYRAFRDAWFGSKFPDEVTRGITQSLKRSQGLVEVWQEDARRVGWVWLDCEPSPQGLMIATLRNLVVEPAHQRRGIGKLMAQRVEAYAREHGAGVLRMETGVENEASQVMFQHAGFTVARLTYEKILEPDGAGG
jgi:ribosomal protein S18 acetylase RimI-like enzyme